MEAALREVSGRRQGIGDTHRQSPLDARGAPCDRAQRSKASETARLLASPAMSLLRPLRLAPPPLSHALAIRLFSAAASRRGPEKLVGPIPPWAHKLPRALLWTHPYLSLARMDKPIGTWLLFWPCGSSRFLVERR